MWGLKLLFNLYLYSAHYCNLIIYVYTLRYTIYKLYFGRRTCPCSISFLMQCILPLLMVFRYNLLSRNIPSPRHSPDRFHKSPDVRRFPETSHRLFRRLFRRISPTISPRDLLESPRGLLEFGNL